MELLIVGVSSKSSIGYQVGELLRKYGHTPVYVSRSGKLGLACDIASPRKLRRLLAKVKPDGVIHAAGVFSSPRALGIINEWEKVRMHLEAKGFGALALADAMVATGRGKIYIALGGRKISAELGFANYTIGNGALFALVQFLAGHGALRSYLVDLPFVEGSTMHAAFARATGDTPKGVPATQVASSIERILKGKYKNGSRVVIGKHGGA
ncbi:MAG: hypothetical protein WA021_01440 [Minisyncoccia bacterium]